MTKVTIPRLCSGWSAEQASKDDEKALSLYFQNYRDRGVSGRFNYIIKHPLETLRAARIIFRLPSLRIEPPTTGAGVFIREVLSPRSLPLRITGFVTGVLKLPNTPGQFVLGPAKQTLRRKMRAAQKLGVSWAEVVNPRERRELLEQAAWYERKHPNVIYRTINPENGDLLNYDLWLAAYSSEGRPLLLSVTPVDGDFALLRYFRTIGSGEGQSNARYLMTAVLAERLVAQGVRYLIDGSFVSELPYGLRHFQQMIGYHTVRIYLARSRRDLQD
jgi:hypothetical protein